ncbi:uncharacterized protein LOC133931173 [Phragmites australis]|uniref:uncharacterized protein LOC133931173 n=1 Tax=Phragmites australis TaxID=29695 RepID=UPI002D7975F0|nr:uncharacterized protein LOC133931173 [Phragmites australis]
MFLMISTPIPVLCWSTISFIITSKNKKRDQAGRGRSMEMAPPCSSGTRPSAAATPPLLLLLRPPSPRRLTSFLPLPVKSRPASSAHCSSSSSSYNGWADLAAAPDLPFPLPLQSRTTKHALFLLLPAAALSLSLSLSLSRLPPLPLLAAAFTAGFAARHLSSTQSRRLSAVLADLDAQVRALRGQLASGASSDPGLLIEAVDRLHDAVLDAAQANNDSTAAVSDALPPVLGALGKELADCFGGWARDTVRDLSSPRKKPKDNNSDVKVLGKANQPPAAPAAAGAGAQAQIDDGNELVDSSIHAAAAVQKSFDSAVVGNACGRPLDMLPFDEDANQPEDAEMGPQGKLGDARLERLVFKHRHGCHGVQSDPFQGASSRFATESMESSLLERTVEIRDRSYRLKIERRDSESQVSEAQEGSPDSFVSNVSSIDPTYNETASTDSDGREFSRNVKEATEILRKARECMMARADEETADTLLYKSARLLSAAVALRPTSLVAVGQLGNTYLLHGELKLKISRELRTLLANSGAFLHGRERVPRSTKVDRRILSRENISSALVDVCEECESLLVEAGRSYRTALAIDSGDVKALYNWGLALIFRAQLLADIGPEAAVDADGVYLAAIDKFDAMLSKSNSYAPEALYRWGTALQQRSHLRPRNNKEKIRLLEQAKSLFEDVLYVEADNKMVREALSSCISELNYHGRWL